MASTNCKDAAAELLAICLDGGQWTHDLLSTLTHDRCSQELFRVVAEGLADRFEPTLCDTYAALFSEALGTDLDRYRRMRVPREFRGPDPKHVLVLSRVTLGADVAITSVILDAAKKRFPNARILFVGARKSWELFEADSRIEYLPLTYPRAGSLRERLDVWRDFVLPPGGIVIDPDSRLTQLGLVPICPEENYYLFESRSYGGDGDESLGTLTRRWVASTFGVEANAYIAPRPGPEAEITISLGVGENPAKRIADPFERELLRALGGKTILIDKGFGGEEAARVEKAIEGLPNVRCWEGAFAPFAAGISKSQLYIGYDSAGQHVAAACGVPLVSVFAGFPTRRMFSRWRPTGPGPVEVVRADDPNPAEILERTLLALRKYGIISA